MDTTSVTTQKNIKVLVNIISYYLEKYDKYNI